MAIAEYGHFNLDDSCWPGRNINSFEKLEQIGEGTYGQVFMARDKLTGEIVALKKLRIDEHREKEGGFPIAVLREIKLLKRLRRHPNIINYKFSVTESPRRLENGKYHAGDFYMAFEYMDHDLSGLSDQQGFSGFSIPQIKCYMLQLLSALHYCHINQVLHRDIKRSNLLIDNNGILKIADFGLATLFCEGKNLTNKVVTLWYRSPELLLGATTYGGAVDMWSVGCVFAELLNNGKPIFPGKNETEQVSMIFELCGSPHYNNNWPDASRLPRYTKFMKPSVIPTVRRVREVFRHFDENALELVEKMLALDPAKRISAKEALLSEYFQHEPLACHPSSLPKYEPSHAFQIKKKKLLEQQHKLKLDSQKRS